MKRFLYAACLLQALALYSVAQVHQAPGVGWEGQGAGIDFVNLDSNPNLEVILMAYDNPPQGNTFRYRVGWNVNASGGTGSWTNTIIVGGAGWEAQGAGATSGDLDNNGIPELIVMAYDNPSGGNTYRYRVGWNIGSNGHASWWGNTVIVAGSGWEAQGADVALTNLDTNSRPEMMVMAYDNPNGGNNFRIRIGWNLNTNGIATHWTSLAQLPGMGWEAEGAGMAVGNIGGTNRPDIVLMAYDGYPGNPKTIRSRIGFDLDSNGNATSWVNQPNFPGFGWAGQGAGLDIASVSGGSVPDIVYMAYDNPSGGNNFRYQINPGPRVNLMLELDRTTNVNWVPDTATRLGGTTTLEAIFNQAAIDLTEVRDDVVADIGGGVYTDAELDAFMTANSDETPAPGQWHVHGALVPRYVDTNVLGIMFDTGQRRGFAAFDWAIGTNEEYMRTTAHELGHALNLEHEDGDGRWRWRGWWFWRRIEITNPGRSIMNQTWLLGNNWDYVWNGASQIHYLSHNLNRWEPSTGLAFTQCH